MRQYRFRPSCHTLVEAKHHVPGKVEAHVDKAHHGKNSYGGYFRSMSHAILTCGYIEVDNLRPIVFKVSEPKVQYFFIDRPYESRFDVENPVIQKRLLETRTGFHPFLILPQRKTP